MRVLFSGVAPWSNTGYGTQGKFIIHNILKNSGHTVFAMPHWGLQGGPLTVDGVTYLPLYRDGWGHDVIGHHVRAIKADVVISFHDVWVLKPDFPKSLGVPWITYSPVDSIPVPPKLATMLCEAKYVLAMSQFGKTEMLKKGIDSIYIPHGINTEIYCPGDKMAARRELGIPEDKFIALIVAANFYYPSRKAFSEQVLAFAEFHKEFPNSQLLFHTALTPTSGAGGLDLNELIRNLDLTHCTANTPEYELCMGVPDESMAQIYRAADVLLGASYAEGFGLCQAEAQACGTPVIIHDFAASPEFLFGGIKVPSGQRFWKLEGCWQAIPSIPAITQALREIYLNPDHYAEEGLKAAARVGAELDWTVVRDRYWRPFLEQVEQDIQSDDLFGQVAAD